jgi:putative tryptophan/tyrosine transport system substrate-binding protein
VTTRRAFIGSLAGGLLTAPFAAWAQQAGKVYRVGYMTVVSRQSAEPLMSIFLRALRDLGWIEGRNLLVEWRWADGQVERLSGFAAELAKLNVDLIVAPQSDSALAAKRATRTIPIVHVVAGDPVADGLVTTLARPGGNVTGLTITPSPEIVGKRLELLKETTEGSRVAVLWNPARHYPYVELALRELNAAARVLGVQLQVLEARGPDEFEPAFAAMVRGQRADALLTFEDSMFWLHRRRLAELEAKHHLPTMHDLREFAEAGSLMAYGPNLADLFRRAAVYVDKILKGAKPGDLPIEQPTKFELVINLKTAKALGLTIPPSLLLRADEVIE